MLYSLVLHRLLLSKRRNTIALPTQSSKLSGRGQRYLEPRSAPVRDRTHKGNRPAHFAHAPRDDRQPQSGPTRLGRKERLENFILHRRRDAYAVVGDGDSQTALAVRGACDLHLAVAPVAPVEFDRLQGVEEQVEQNLLERGDLFSVKFQVGPQIGRNGDRAPLGFGPAERQHALDDLAQPGRRAGHARRTRKTEQLRDGAVQSVDLAGDQVEVAGVLAADPLVFAHHLGDRLDGAERIFDFVRDGRGHLAELRQAFAFAQLAFELHLLFEQLAVLDRGGQVAREHEQHFALFGGQGVRRAAHDDQPDHAPLAPQRESRDRFQLFEQWSLFDFGQLAFFGDAANFRLFALGVAARDDRDLFQLQRFAQPAFGELNEVPQLSIAGRRRAYLRHQLAVEFDFVRE